MNARSIHNSSDGCYQFDHCASRNATSLVYWLPACMGRLRRDGQCCGREVQCGRRTKINWTKTAHNTRICTWICGHVGLVPIHTRMHTPLCGYGLSTGPTESLSTWWLRNRSPPDSQQKQQQQAVLNSTLAQEPSLLVQCAIGDWHSWLGCKGTLSKHVKICRATWFHVSVLASAGECFAKVATKIKREKTYHAIEG